MTRYGVGLAIVSSVHRPFRCHACSDPRKAVHIHVPFRLLAPAKGAVTL